jgi:FlaG/FlaF family flagellin (archaellin)
MEALILLVLIMLVLAAVFGEENTEQAKSEAHRIGNTTIDTMQQVSDTFEQYIEESTKPYRKQ